MAAERNKNRITNPLKQTIMKLNASIELKSRLTHAAENGSVIAADILTEIKRNADVAEIIRGSYNFFSTKRKRSNMENYQRIDGVQQGPREREFPRPQQPTGAVVS